MVVTCLQRTQIWVWLYVTRLQATERFSCVAVGFSAISFSADSKSEKSYLATHISKWGLGGKMVDRLFMIFYDLQVK